MGAGYYSDYSPRDLASCVMQCSSYSEIATTLAARLQFVTIAAFEVLSFYGRRREQNYVVRRNKVSLLYSTPLTLVLLYS